MKAKHALGAMAVLALSAPAAWAHHSFAMFDNSKSVVIEGTVKEFQWTNPHTFIEVMAPDPKTGKIVQWSVEGSPITSLKRRGWTSQSLKAGDKVVVTLFPLRSGNPGGGLDKVTVNGKPVGGAPPTSTLPVASPPAS